jgi:lipopolysaccharide export system protein LptA
MNLRTPAALAFLLTAGIALAQAQSPAKDAAKLPNAFQGFSRDTDQPVTIEADALEIRDKDSYAIFTGNVVVKQGDSTMRSRELKVHYEGSMRDASRERKSEPAPAKSASGQKATNDPAQRIRRIEALGGVIVTNKDQKASGDRGVFDMPTNTATITGNVVVSQGPNVMRADKLIVDMKTGLSRMEAGSKDGNKRVQGLFVPSSIDNKKSPQPK